MNDTIFKIVYQSATLLGTSKEKEIILREPEAFSFIEKCHRMHHSIISIQHV